MMKERLRQYIGCVLIYPDPPIEMSVEPVNQRFTIVGPQAIPGWVQHCRLEGAESCLERQRNALPSERIESDGRFLNRDPAVAGNLR